MATATLDTNIYVSALVFGGTPRRLIDLAIDAELDVAISAPILDETVGVLQHKFNWSPQQVGQAIEQFFGAQSRRLRWVSALGFRCTA